MHIGLHTTSIIPVICFILAVAVIYLIIHLYFTRAWHFKPWRRSLSTSTPKIPFACLSCLHSPVLLLLLLLLNCSVLCVFWPMLCLLMLGRRPIIIYLLCHITSWFLLTSSGHEYTSILPVLDDHYLVLSASTPYIAQIFSDHLDSI